MTHTSKPTCTIVAKGDRHNSLNILRGILDWHNCHAENPARVDNQMSEARFGHPCRIAVILLFHLAHVPEIMPQALRNDAPHVFRLTNSSFRYRAKQRYIQLWKMFNRCPRGAWGIAMTRIHISRLASRVWLSESHSCKTNKTWYRQHTSLNVECGNRSSPLNRVQR